MKNMGEKGNYDTEKEVRIKDIDRNGEKQSGRRKINDKIIIKVKPSWFHHVESVILQQ